MSMTVSEVKQAFTPERYYAEHLPGQFGKPTGNGWYQWKGLCPFHNDKRPGSFVVNKETGAFKCFSCNEAGGDILDFHMKRYHQTFCVAYNQLKGVIACAR